MRPNTKCVPFCWSVRRSGASSLSSELPVFAVPNNAFRTSFPQRRRAVECHYMAQPWPTIYAVINLRCLEQYNCAKGCANRLTRMKNGSSLMFSVCAVRVWVPALCSDCRKSARALCSDCFFFAIFFENRRPHAASRVDENQKKARP